MKTIQTSKTLVDFKGKNLERDGADITIGEVLSAILAGKTSNPTLAWQLGKKFATEKAVDLKAEDVVFLKKEIEDNEQWFSVVKGQLIEILEEKDK